MTAVSAATAIVVKEVWGEYSVVARQNSTLKTRNTNSTAEKFLRLISVFEVVFVRLNDFVQSNKGFRFTLL